MFTGLRERFNLLATGILEVAARFLHIDLYGMADPVTCSTSFACPDVETIYDYQPRTALRIDTSLKYDQLSFPDDFILTQTPSGNPLCMFADDKGGTKIYEYDASDNTILIKSGWGATVTAEGSIIWHGPRCDCRGEIHILAPFGWDVRGLEAGGTIEVYQSQTFDSGNWDRDEAFWSSEYGQRFEILYNTDELPKIITQEVSYDSNNDSPFSKTIYRQEHLRRYNIKEFEAWWHQLARETDNVYWYPPLAVFQGVNSRHLQLNKVITRIDEFIERWDDDVDAFDNFRNQDTLPSWSDHWDEY